MSEKASFYSRDPGTAEGGVADAGKKRPYNGVERRRDNRRKQADRREEVRFEIKKEDRRKTEGRRKDDQTPKYY